MKIFFTFSAFLFFTFQTVACPCFECPGESKPNSPRVIYKPITLYKNPLTGMLWCKVQPQLYFNSVAIRFPKNSLATASFQLNLLHRFVDPNDDWGLTQHRNDSRKIVLDEHLEYAEYDASELFYANEDCFSFDIEQVSGIPFDSLKLQLVLLWVPPLNLSIPKRLASRANCDSPFVIPQSVWRKGLADPIPGRSSTPTHHCIVHHSAGGNNDTSYTNLVRSYYVFHTQVNGWDDIGYNYLIAANGDIYAGRDPEKPGIRQDDVLGAHFCSKNNNTMGVCMIGDFTSVSPSDEAMSSLIHLFGWKVRKDSLDPYGSFRHPDANGNLLNVISGHRDGCNTSCPGDYLYAKLDSVKQGVALCAVVSGFQNAVALSHIHILQCPEGIEISNIPVGTSVELLDMTGRLIQKQKSGLQSIRFENYNTRSQVGILRIGFKDAYLVEKVFIP